MRKTMFSLRLSLLFFLPFSCFANQEQIIQDHLTIKDFAQAEEVARFAFENESDSSLFFKLYLQTLAKRGKIEEMMKLWTSFQKDHPEILSSSDLLEILAWGIIENGGEALKPSIRASALSAGAKSQSAKGVRLLENALKDRNAWVRLHAVRLSSTLFDPSLKKNILELVFSEPQLNVRMEAVRSLGRMQIEEGKEQLKWLISSDDSPPELKAAAIEALVLLLDTVPREEIASLVKSERMGLRLLASRAVMLLGLKRDLDLLLPLLEDPSHDVRIAVIQALGVLERQEDNAVLHLLKDPHPHVALAASWYFALKGHKGMFDRWLADEEQEIRLLAASSLAASGHVQEMEKHLLSSSDGLVKLNLAIGLVRYRHAISLACKTICAQLNSSQKWMWQEEGIWRRVAPSTAFHVRELPHFPKAMDQTVRLEMLKMVLCLAYPGSAQALKNFLKYSVTDVMPFVMSLLLTEGDEEAVHIVRGLMQTEDKQVRSYACLLLALWDNDAEAIKELQRLYYLCSRSMKERLLQGMGEIGDETLIAFFVEQMSRGSMNIKVIAAVSLLQTLNQ